MDAVRSKTTSADEASGRARTVAVEPCQYVRPRRACPPYACAWYLVGHFTITVSLLNTPSGASDPCSTMSECSLKNSSGRIAVVGGGKHRIVVDQREVRHRALRLAAERVGQQLAADAHRRALLHVPRQRLADGEVVDRRALKRVERQVADSHGQQSHGYDEFALAGKEALRRSR